MAERPQPFEKDGSATIGRLKEDCHSTGASRALHMHTSRGVPRKARAAPLVASSLKTVFHPQSVQIVGPILHHLPAFRQILGAVVNTAYLVAQIVGQLLFNGIGRIALLVENGACH